MIKSVTLKKLLKLSVLQYPHLYMEVIILHLMEFLGRLTESVYTKFSA